MATATILAHNGVTLAASVAPLAMLDKSVKAKGKAKGKAHVITPAMVAAARDNLREAVCGVVTTRRALADAIRAYRAVGVSDEAVERDLEIFALMAALDCDEARAKVVRDLAGATSTKAADDEKRTESEERAWAAARQTKSRAMADALPPEEKAARKAARAARIALAEGRAAARNAAPVEAAKEREAKDGEAVEAPAPREEKTPAHIAARVREGATAMRSQLTHLFNAGAKFWHGAERDAMDAAQKALAALAETIERREKELLADD